MRYDTPIYFQKLTPGEYDPATGNYGEDTISEDMKSALLRRRHRARASTSSGRARQRRQHRSRLPGSVDTVR